MTTLAQIAKRIDAANLAAIIFVVAVAFGA